LDLHHYPCDVSDSKQVAETWDKIIKEHGKVNILVNNAAVSICRSVTEVSMDDVNTVMNTNFVAVV